MAKLCDTIAWAMFCGAVIAWLFVGSAWASTYDHAASSKGEIVIMIAFVCIVATFVYGAIRNSGTMAEHEPTVDDLEALKRGDNTFPRKGRPL